MGPCDREMLDTWHCNNLGCTLEVTYLSFFLFITHTPRMVVMTASTAMIRPPTTAAEEAQTATPLPASNEVATVYE